MGEFEVGDRIRVDIPDESNVDHARYHGKHGEIITVIDGDVDRFRVEFDDGDYADFLPQALRPPITE